MLHQHHHFSKGTCQMSTGFVSITNISYFQAGHWRSTPNTQRQVAKIPMRRHKRALGRANAAQERQAGAVRGSLARAKKKNMRQRGRRCQARGERLKDCRHRSVTRDYPRTFRQKQISNKQLINTCLSVDTMGP